MKKFLLFTNLLIISLFAGNLSYAAPSDVSFDFQYLHPTNPLRAEIDTSKGNCVVLKSDKKTELDFILKLSVFDPAATDANKPSGCAESCAKQREKCQRTYVYIWDGYRIVSMVTIVGTSITRVSQDSNYAVVPSGNTVTIEPK